MRKEILRAVGAMLVIFVLLGVIKYRQISSEIEAHASFTPPPEAVTAITVKDELWRETHSVVGQLTAVKGVIVSAEEAGRVAKIHFESGSTVNQGDILIELDLSVENANLKAALAKQDWASKKLLRVQTLRNKNAVSKEDLDDAESSFLQAQAEVHALQARIERRQIVAPFAGKTGIRMVNLGEYVQAGTKVVPINSLESLYLNFTLPQTMLNHIAVGQPLTFNVDTFPDENFEGHIAAIDSEVNESTRNISVQAAVANSAEKFRPGMFAKVNLELPIQTKVIPIPASSVTYAPYGDSVWVIEQSKDANGNEIEAVRSQIVKLGMRRGEQVAILSGLMPGQRIVTSGGFKLRPGLAIFVNENFTPGNSSSPATTDS